MVRYLHFWNECHILKASWISQDLKCVLCKKIQFNFIEGYCDHVKRHIPKSQHEICTQFCCPACEFEETRTSFNSVGRLKQHMTQLHPQYLEPKTSSSEQPPIAKRLRTDEYLQHFSTKQTLVDDDSSSFAEHLYENHTLTDGYLSFDHAQNVYKPIVCGADRESGNTSKIVLKWIPIARLNYILSYWHYQKVSDNTVIIL